MLSENNLSVLKENFNLELSEKSLDLFKNWGELFYEYNAHTNLMSRNDTDNIFEKHIFDSLAILKWSDFNPHKKQKILDVGTGGGFPSVILAMCFPELEIVANDSRIKKINFIIEIKDKLELDNLKISYARAEDLEPLNCDIVTSRAVGKINDVWRLSQKHIKEGGYFVTYKAKTLDEELLQLKDKTAEIFPYTLPTKEQHQRYIAVIKK